MISKQQRLGMSRPAGGGIHVVSTGVEERRAIQSRIYGTDDEELILKRWWTSIERLPSAKASILGVPSDAGAGFTRGSNRAPASIRAHLLDAPHHPMWSSDVVDLGDVFTIPHFLSDEMLSDSQRADARSRLYGQDAPANWPVSPLDICQSVLADAYARHPDLVPIVLGGDHSVGWPAFAAAFAHWEQTQARRIGLLHFDAHTDLLADRLGVKYCFATWAWHANELLGRDGRLVQVGIRTSGRTQTHWESTLGVRQYWAQQALELGIDALADEIIERYQRLGVDALYISNDIDGTDPEFASATGTPEPDGLTPELVSGITRRIGSVIPLIGADLVEVAPPLAGHQSGEPKRTLETACRYLEDFFDLAGVSRP